MTRFIKRVIDDKIIFENPADKTTIAVKHMDDEYTYDIIKIDESIALDFLDYVVEELKKTKDIQVLFSLYESEQLESLLDRHDIKVSNYQYKIRNTEYELSTRLDSSTELDEESKDYYLVHINETAKINHEYFNPKSKFQEYTNLWFSNTEYEFKVYRKDDKIVGIVEFKVFGNLTDDNATEDIFSVSDRLCIRCLFTEDLEMIKYILKDLSNTYKKNILITFTYTDALLKKAVTELDGKFDYCQYILIDEN